jgi:transposase
MFCGRDICAGQKRGRQVGKTKRGKGTKIMGIADRHGLPLALRTESASPAEVKLVTATLEARAVAEVPERLIGDKAYDSDRLDEQLMQEYGTELIAPNKVNRRVPTQDGRPLRRYVHRWKVERLFAWLFNFRRVVVRYEYHAENFQGFVHLAAAVILLRYLWDGFYQLLTKKPHNQRVLYPHSMKKYCSTILIGDDDPMTSEGAAVEITGRQLPVAANHDRNENQAAQLPWDLSIASGFDFW